jgi:hypothetical protein
MKYHNGVVLGNRVRVGPIRKKSEEEKRKNFFIERRVCRIESRRRYNPPTTTTTSCSNNGDVGLFLSHACSMRSLLFGCLYFFRFPSSYLVSAWRRVIFTHLIDRPEQMSFSLSMDVVQTGRPYRRRIRFSTLEVLGTFFFIFF